MVGGGRCTETSDPAKNAQVFVHFLALAGGGSRGKGFGFGGIRLPGFNFWTLHGFTCAHGIWGENFIAFIMPCAINQFECMS